ncbi:MAG: outer membrane beta-barrel protein [Halieaceae bacterium]
MLTLASGQSLAADPASVSAGPFEITPTLGLDAKYDDNIFNSSDDEEDDTIFLIHPNIEAVAKDRNNEYTLELDLVDGTYNDSGDDDYTDWSVAGDAHVEFNSKNMIDVSAGFYSLHEDRGTGFSEGQQALLIDEPDEYEDTVFAGHYTYGGADSKGRLKIGGDYLDKDYTNHEPESDTRDRENNTFDGTFYWKIAPKTDVLGEVSYTDVDYKTDFTDGTPQLDSDETRFLLGVTWEATGKTTGTIKLGVLNKDFDDSARDDFDNEFTWDADVTWRPREQHVFQFGAAQVVQETTGTGDFINTDEFTAAWLWDFNSRADVYASLRYATDDYENSRRDDDLYYAEVGAKYEFRRWLDVRVSYTYDKRDSNNQPDDLDYEKNIFLIGFDLSL